MTSHARIDADGSLRLPADLLDRNGLGSGSDVIIDETAEGIVIRRRVPEALRQVQDWSRELLKDKSNSTVDDFIAERRREADSEVSVVVDASAVLLLILGEPGADRMASRWKGAIIASVNVSEIAGFLAKRGAGGDDIRSQLASLSMIVVPVDADVAFEAGMLQPPGAPFGLSLGDRTCLALAKRCGATALTADRTWKDFGELVGIEVELVR